MFLFGKTLNEFLFQIHFLNACLERQGNHYQLRVLVVTKKGKSCGIAVRTGFDAVITYTCGGRVRMESPFKSAKESNMGERGKLENVFLY